MKKRGIILLVVGAILLITSVVEIISLIEIDKAKKEAYEKADNTPITYSFKGELSGNTAKDASTLLSNPDKIVEDSTAHDAARREATTYAQKYNGKFEQLCILVPIVVVYFIILLIIRKKTDWFGQRRATLMQQGEIQKPNAP